MGVRAWISGAPSEVAPGSTVEGTVQVQTTETAELAELTITLYGRVSSRIFRELSIAVVPLQGRWKGEATFCEKVVALIDQVATLPVGQHQFPFKLKVPETAEIVLPDTKREKRKKEWTPNVPPFVGLDITDPPLPPSLTVKSEQNGFLWWGTSSANIEYGLKVSGKMEGPQTGYQRTPPFSCVQKLVVGGPMVMQKLAGDIQWMNLDQSLGGAHRAVTASVQFPAVLSQRKVLPIQLKVDGGGFALVSLKAKLLTDYTVRGRSSFLRENTSPAISEEKLLVWEGKADLSPGQTHLVESAPLSCTAAVVKFATLNVACVSHQLEVKFKLQDNKGKVISGVFNTVPVDIRGPHLFQV